MKNMYFRNMCMIGILIFIFAQSFAFSADVEKIIQISTSDFNEWKLRGPKLISKWAIGKVKIDPKNEEKFIVLPSGKETPVLINKSKGSVDIFTRQVFGDCLLELEVLIPKKSNSGIYLMGQYEIQIKDSHGKGMNLKEDDMGGIIGTSKPLLNAAKKAGAWQRYVIQFKAPRFKNGKRAAPAEFVKVTLNGQVVQESVKMENGPTSGALQKNEVARGPIMLQGGLGAVAYRNIKVTVLKK